MHVATRTLRGTSRNVKILFSRPVFGTIFLFVIAMAKTTSRENIFLRGQYDNKPYNQAKNDSRNLKFCWL